MPEDLTITGFAGLHYELAKAVILQNGGRQIEIDGVEGFQIVTEKPKNIEPLPAPLHRVQELRREWWPLILEDLSGDSTQQARAVYAAICLELVDKIAPKRAGDWNRALTAIQPHYEALFGDEQWAQEAKHYFNDVVNHKNAHPKYPFGYGEFK